jgi:hypothetical protein
MEGGSNMSFESGYIHNSLILNSYRYPGAVLDFTSPEEKFSGVFDKVHICRAKKKKKKKN